MPLRHLDHSNSERHARAHHHIKISDSAAADFDWTSHCGKCRPLHFNYLYGCEQSNNNILVYTMLWIDEAMYNGREETYINIPIHKHIRGRKEVVKQRWFNQKKYINT